MANRILLKDWVVCPYTADITTGRKEWYVGVVLKIFSSGDRAKVEVVYNPFENGDGFDINTVRAGKLANEDTKRLSQLWMQEGDLFEIGVLEKRYTAKELTVTNGELMVIVEDVDCRITTFREVSLRDRITFVYGV